VIFRRFGSGGKNRQRRHEIGAAGDGNFGYGAPYHQAWEYRQLPGAGALQWAWETLALPLYTPIGAGTRNQRQFKATASNPVMVAVQGITIQPLGGSPIQGDLTGEFVTQPLMDVQQAEASGIVYPSYNAPPNQFELPATATA
jgi:hypothetical protein